MRGENKAFDVGFRGVTHTEQNLTGGNRRICVDMKLVGSPLTRNPPSPIRLDSPDFALGDWDIQTPKQLPVTISLSGELRG